jgi:hypothetical protein
MNRTLKREREIGSNRYRTNWRQVAGLLVITHAYFFLGFI